MITQQEVQTLGTLTKPHGVNGEMVLTVENSLLDMAEPEYLVCLMDGILVPFFIDSLRTKSATNMLVMFDGIDTIEKARRMQGVRVFFPIKFAPKENNPEYGFDYFLGFTVSDAEQGEIGIVRYIDDSTTNVLFEVERPDGCTVMIPAAEDFIESIDQADRTILFRLPEGLLDL